MRTLSCSDVEKEYLENITQVSEEDIEMINKKSGFNGARKKALFIVILISVGAVICIFISLKLLIMLLILLFLYIFDLIKILRIKYTPACYAVVTEKKERWSKYNNNTSVKPYDQTDSVGSANRKEGLTYVVRSYYYCSVDINGEIYDHVCCYAKDYDAINVGDTVVIGGNAGLPIVYKCCSETENR